MKKIFLSLVLVLFMASVAGAADKGFYSRNTPPYTALHTLSTWASVTTGQTGTAVDLGMPFSTITCMTTQGSGTATEIVITLAGSLDGTNYMTIKTVTSGSWPNIQTTNAAAAVPVLYIKATYTSVTGGLLVVPVFKCMGSR